MKNGIDFSLWEQGGNVVLALSGPVGEATVSLLRSRVEEMATPDHPIVLDLLRVPSIDEKAVVALLTLQSDLRGKGTEIVLVATSQEVLERLAPYRHLFSVHPSVQSLLATGFQTKGIRFSRRTGIRVAAPIAAFFGLLLAGWMSTLVVVVVWQFREMRRGSAEVRDLKFQIQAEKGRIEELQARLKPMEDLGLLELPKARRIRSAPKPTPTVSDTNRPQVP